METITVTIGRNVDDVPMSQDRWNAYVTMVRDEVTRVTSELWAVAPYKGAWNGTHEDAMLFYGPVNVSYWHDTFAENLSNIAAYYGQHSIGLAIGESELVRAWKVEPVRDAAGLTYN